MSNTEKNVSCTASTVSVENSAIWQVPSSKTRPGSTNRRSSFPSDARRKPSRITRKGGPLNDVQRSEIQRVQYWGHTYGSYQSYWATLRVVIIAYTWAYQVGIAANLKVKAIRTLNNGRRAISLVKYGLNFIADNLFNPFWPTKINVFDFLSCT